MELHIAPPSFRLNTPNFSISPKIPGGNRKENARLIYTAAMRVRRERTKRLRKDGMNKGKSCSREVEKELDLNRNKCGLITGRLTFS